MYIVRVVKWKRIFSSVVFGKNGMAKYKKIAGFSHRSTSNWDLQLLWV